GWGKNSGSMGPNLNLIAKANSGVAVFAAGLTLAAHKFEFSAEIAYNTFLKLILMPLALLFVGMACHLNSEHLQMMVLEGITASILNHYCQPVYVYTRTGTASLAVSVLGFVVTAPLWIYVSRLVS
ncbi:AEC family transporter, partial [Escherichia coli]